MGAGIARLLAARGVGGKARPFVVGAEIEAHLTGRAPGAEHFGAGAAALRREAGIAEQRIGGIIAGAAGFRECETGVQIERIAAVLQPGPARSLARALIFRRVGEHIERRGETVDLVAAVGVTRGQRGGEAVGQLRPAAPADAPLAKAVALGAAGGGGKAVGAGIAAVHREAVTLSDHARVDLPVDAVARPIFCGGFDPVYLARGHGEHAADRLAAPDDAVRSAQQLDLADAAQRQPAEVIGAARRGDFVDARAIDQHQELFGAGAAHEDAGRAARRAVARKSQAGQPLQHAGDVRALDRGDFPVADDRDRLAGIADDAARTGGDHGDKIVADRIGSGLDIALGQRRKRQRQQRDGGNIAQIHEHNPSNTNANAVHGERPTGLSRGPRCSRYYPARMRNDHRGQVSWLSGSSLPARLPGPKTSGMLDRSLPGYSCGGSAEFSSASLFGPVSRTTRDAPPR